MNLENKSSRIIPWAFDPEDTKKWEQTRYDLQNSGDIIRFGGSEISQVVNNNKYDGALYLFNVKLGKTVPKKPSIRMIHGNQVENTILDYIRAYDVSNPSSEVTAENYLNKNFIRNIYKANFFIESDDYPAILISLDGVLPEGEPSLHDPELLMEFDTDIEVKNVSFSAFNSWNGEIPPYYYVQKQSQLASTGAPYGYFVALVDNSDLHIWKVDADPEWQDYINLQTVDLSLKIGRAKEIQYQLDNCALSEEQRELLLTEFYELEPIAGAEENTTQMLKDMYSSDSEEVLDGNAEDYNLAVTYLETHNEIKELEKLKTKTKNQLLQKMKGYNVMEIEDITVKGGARFGVTKKKGKK